MIGTCWKLVSHRFQRVNLFAFLNEINLCLTNSFKSLRQKIDGKLLKTAFFWSRVLSDLIYAENGDLTWFKQEWGPKYQEMLCFAIAKWLFVLPILRLKTPKISKDKAFHSIACKKYWKKCTSWEKAVTRS